MLREVRQVRQIAKENRRRWFSDDQMDLTVWFDDQGVITGFELCYDKGTKEHALRWRNGLGFLHEGVDDGEGRPGRFKGTPILVPDGTFDTNNISRLFAEQSREIDHDIADFVLRRLAEAPAGRGG
ncbi:MAG: hypothetical protein M0042_12375 [Nitrospiraceae bacterium]|nr:hypothetical protein [Nitrospiraceae bacterium]